MKMFFRKYMILLVSCLSNSSSFLFPMISYTNKSVNIHLIQGDITQLKGVDAIVNAANEQLSHGGGVALAISNAAGHLLQKASDDYVIKNGAISVGSACTTYSFDLKKNGVKHIIHAVGPDCRDEMQNNDRKHLLLLAYRSSMEQAFYNNDESIAFPAISTAIFGYRPLEDAIQIAVDTVIDSINMRLEPKIKDVYFVLFSSNDFALYKKYLDNKLLTMLN